MYCYCSLTAGILFGNKHVLPEIVTLILTPNVIIQQNTSFYLVKTNTFNRGSFYKISPLTKNFATYSILLN